MLETHGARAIAEAAQNTIDLELNGDVEMAKTWRRRQVGDDSHTSVRLPHRFRIRNHLVKAL
nr:MULTISPECIES: hypothetical protein [Bradyrhizobium]